MRVGGTRSPGGAPMTPDTQVALSSSTKPIGGVLALRLVELAALSLDEPVAPWLPELAEPRVLVGPEADLTATVPAERPITLRHLLTMTPGFGWVSEPGPLADALAREQVAPGPFCPPISPDDFMSRLGSLPLADQPGTAWRHHTNSDVLGVLLARATGSSVPELLTEHVLEPLGSTTPPSSRTQSGWRHHSPRPSPSTPPRRLPSTTSGACSSPGHDILTTMSRALVLVDIQNDFCEGAPSP